MSFIVTCCQCPPHVQSEFPDVVGAEEYIKRHNGITGHEAEVEP
ncbi:hypothetical protein [Mycolicibacterium brisbanense]|nr:hypothetical protein [Mycolicibacterium brisbanense]